MGIAASIVLFVALFAYTFWPEKNPFTQRAASRLDFLRERRDAVFANLRDLNFEYKAGKYPEEDYATQRALLEDEATTIVTEIDVLERA
ncbi:hypothetical protein Terro_2499 [Terriglobus roseus DSM 18391]|uniref:C-type cytochrome biogenesis protein CcmI n=1 Tax=Terriglobus roseus (strain DSM 18391 / NRRL B-41598 / KBS 63) TaxID=926566 RepID=I3ZGN8_TERRK|nr:hypothetical protein [Terriglobus roseus]AFL88406.1 hypothetical protein Terro_2135 [Terriglobus roseus DSM 18391]AFL88747.1 hypothetical protein Terro_2499 [Terriglobus roseus DSM 18391]